MHEVELYTGFDNKYGHPTILCKQCKKMIRLFPLKMNLAGWLIKIKHFSTLHPSDKVEEYIDFLEKED